ncbi:FAD/NAD(P)-binding protein [Streptomyces sp. NPDC003006]
MRAELRVCIVGLGSRGCSVLERIVTLAQNSTSFSTVCVDIVDPASSGQGLHATDQPDYLLLNTLCGEISMFPGEESVGAETGKDGPGLYEWVTERGLRMGPDGRTVSTTGRAIAPDDFLPRRILGEYLQWFFERTCRLAPDNVRIRMHRSAAVDLELDEATDSTRITLADGTLIETDFAFLTLGHIGNEQPGKPRENPGTVLRCVTDPYPLPESVAAVEPGSSLAVAGFGLSAMDAVAALTVGRGGTFSRESGQVRYLAGGAEPRIVLYSRSGMPFRVRPERPEMISRFQPVALTREVVASMRSAGPLDFDERLLPLLMSEMRIAHHRCRTLVEEGPTAEEAVAADLLQATASGRLTAALDLLDQVHGAFDPVALWDPSVTMDRRDSASYQRWLTATVRDDLTEADKGLTLSPVKAALEAVREVRDILRDAVNFRGLTGSSLEDFLCHTVPLMNRAVVGPQKDRYAELLALADAGIVRFPFGPAPLVTPGQGEATGRWTLTSTCLEDPHRESVDWLCAGNAPWPGLETSASPLVRSLHRRRVLSPLLPGSARVATADVDEALHPVGPDGRSHRRLWLIGPLTEGATFYNHLIPTPGYSRAFVDAHRCVTDMFGQFTGEQRAENPARPAPKETSCL